MKCSPRKCRLSCRSGHTEHWLKSEVGKTGRFPPDDDLADFSGSTFVDFLARIRIFFETGNRAVYVQYISSSIHIVKYNYVRFL